MGRAGKEMKSGSCFILGLPAAGKTSYLAALAYSLEQTDIQTKFKWHKFTENHQYLALLAETWAKGEEVPRTNSGTEQERLHIQLLDSEGQVFQVVFPFWRDISKAVSLTRNGKGACRSNRSLWEHHALCQSGKHEGAGVNFGASR